MAPSISTPSRHGRLNRPRAFALVALVLLAELVFSGPRDGVVDQSPEDKKEYLIKAAFLYNFASFATWPSGRFEADDAPIIVGVLGDDPFKNGLERTLEDRLVGARSFEIVRFASLDELERKRVEENFTLPHLLFVSTSERPSFDKICNTTSGQSVLLVSEFDEALSLGGVINFFIEKRSARFEVQLDELQRRDLKLSSRLLALARIRRDETNE